MEESYPLSPLQQGLLFEQIKDPQPGLNVVQVLCDLRERLDARRFFRAWKLVVDRHHILRTGFRWETEGPPCQEVHREPALPWDERDWRKFSSRKLAGQWEEFLRLDRGRGFDLEVPPLMRVALFRTGWHRWRLCWTFHHLLLDGRGLLLVLDEVFANYEALKLGDAPVLASAIHYRKLVEWHQGADWSVAEKFWRESLRGIHAPTLLPIIRASVPPDEARVAWAENQIELSSRATADLRQLARQFDVTMNTVLQAAWGLLLSRYSGEEEVVFGAIRACRKSNVPEAEKIVGLFVNTLPVRVRIRGDMQLEELLRELRSQWVAMRDYENTPLIHMQGWSGAPRGMPLFETVFNFQEPSWDLALAAQGGRWRRRCFSLRNKSGYPLTLDIYGGGPGLILKLVYDPRRLEALVVARMLGHYETLLKSMAEDPTVPPSRIQMLTPAERRQLLGWSLAATRYPRTSTIHELFEGQVRRTPQAVAVVFGDGQLTYQKLNFRANRIANFLGSRGVRRGTMVGICLERSVDMVAAMLGILKAGGIYVPLDPDHPKERLALVLRDTATPVLLTQERLLAQLPKSSAEVICLDRDWKLIRQHGSDPVQGGASADDLAYVIYTSGSTGTPKGVCVPHRGVVRLVKNTDYISVRRDDRIAQAANASFDAATFEIWGALLNGARTVGITKETLLSPPELATLIREQGITTMFLTTALFNQMAREAPDAFRGLRHLLFGGEASDPGCVRIVLNCGAPQRLLHVYGPTEATTFATWFQVTRVADDAPTVPIGRPISNTTVYVLDRNRRPVPIGVPGELYAGGDGLARCYLNQPELTAEKFVSDPFSSDSTARIYRTGDLVRWLPDGTIEFMGRLDHQVKVRGFRIELGEIESALLLHPAVRAAVVICEDEPENKRLVAYYVAGTAITARDLVGFLKEKLPAYMIPAVFEPLEALPLSPNGKVDRKALPRPGQLEREGAQDYVAPRTAVEEIVAGVWSDVLNLPLIGANDHFFELGGHSLLATKAVSRLRKIFNLEIPIRLLFETPTAGAFAAGIRNLQDRAEGRPRPEIAGASREGPLPLSFHQDRIFRSAADSPDGIHNNPIPFRLKGPLNIPALERGLTELVRRHEILRTTFHTVNGQPSQTVLPPAAFSLRVIVMKGHRRDREPIERIFREETLRPFNLESESAFRVVLLRWSATEHRLLFVFHGMVYDGTVRETFFPQLSELYAAYVAGGVPRLSDPKLHYADFAVWQRQWLRQGSPVYQREFDYWKNQLRGELRPLQLPFIRPKPAEQNVPDAYQIAPLTGDLARALKMISRTHGTTLFMTMLAGFKILLGHYTGERDVLVGSYFGNRNHPELECVFGPFSNLLALRTDLAGDPSFREVLERVRETVLQAMAHQDLPFDELLENLRKEGRAVPEVRVIMMLTNVARPIFSLDGLRIGRAPGRGYGHIRSMPWGFTLNVRQDGDRLVAGWACDTDLYDPEGVQRMCRDFFVLLEKAAADIAVPFSALKPEPPLILPD